MHAFRNYFLLACASLFLFACHSGKKKTTLPGDELVEIGDFIGFFPIVKLPFQVTDSTLLKREKDSLVISYNVYSQFIPDSVLHSLFGKGNKPGIYPLARVKGDETYLFAKTVVAEKHLGVLIAFDKKNKFIAAMPLLKQDLLPSTQQISSMDGHYSIRKTILRKNPDGSTSDGNDVYVLNNASRNFMLITTDALDDNITDLTNPIDTFSRKQKFTADYGSGKTNLVSIRDGRKADRVTFFIYFTQNNGECTGELKGEAMLKSANTAEYHAGGDPCSLLFTFSPTAVTVKELEGCGSRRGLRCSFDGTYIKRKEIKLKPAKENKARSSKDKKSVHH